MITFTIEGPPVPKGRSRISTRGGKVRTYTPPKTRAYEALIALRAKEAMKGRKPFEGPIYIDIVAYLAEPKSVQGNFPIAKPDLSNIIKAIEDGCNGIAYRDDAQIVRITAAKFYAAKDQQSVFVQIEPLDL